MTRSILATAVLLAPVAWPAVAMAEPIEVCTDTGEIPENEVSYSVRESGVAVGWSATLAKGGGVRQCFQVRER